MASNDKKMESKLIFDMEGFKKTLQTLKENGVTFTSAHEVELDENGKWHNKRRIF
jgi:hypothetical protein